MPPCELCEVEASRILTSDALAVLLPAELLTGTQQAAPLVAQPGAFTSKLYVQVGHEEET
jgi:hypothetical protein